MIYGMHLPNASQEVIGPSTREMVFMADYNSLFNPGKVLAGCNTLRGQIWQPQSNR
jgi:hypothetical protein